VRKIDVRLDAKLAKDGSVVCMVECEGQRARLTFTGTDVQLDVPEQAPAAGEHMDPQQEPGYVPDHSQWVDAAERDEDGGFTGNVVQEPYR
jgi:hypothetical protein